MDISVSGPICSVFVADPTPDRPHMLGPGKVFLPLYLGPSNYWYCAHFTEGTSPASAHVAGAAALVLDLLPSLSSDQVVDSLVTWGRAVDPWEPPYLYLVNWHLYSVDKGDVNCDSQIVSSDVIYLVNYVFKGGPDPCPFPLNGDVDCTGAVNSADVTYLVNYVFKAGPAPLYCKLV